MIDILVQIVLWAVFLIVALVGLSRFIRSRYRLPFPCDELHHAQCEDGVFVALYHVKPDRVLYEQPVFLCHGMGSNRYNLHFKKGFSLADHLAACGFDVWILELRGHGRSDWPAGGYTFDDIARMDLPAAMRRVLELTGAKDLLFLGHSMGGMLLYAHLATTEDSPIRAAIAAASPGRLGKMWMIKFAWLLRLFPKVSIAFYFGLLLPIVPWIGRWRPEYNTDNVDARLVREMGANGVTHESTGLLLQFADWMKHGSFASMDGFDYLAGAANINRPLLFLAGAKDELVPPKFVRDFYVNTPEQYREWKILGHQSGLLRDYGHVDMLMGHGAAEEVYPIISGWLKSHAETKG